MARLFSGSRLRLFHMMLNRIREMNLITLPSQPECMDPGGATNVEDRRWRGRKMPSQDVLGPLALELANATRESVGLIDLSVVFEHLCRQCFKRRHWLRHRSSPRPRSLECRAS